MSSTAKLERAGWIWCGQCGTANQYAQFLQDFIIDGSKATLYIAADMNYAAFINGQYVPGFAYSDYPDCRSVDALDITPYLRCGSNRLCVIGYCQVTSSHTYRQGLPGVRFAVYAGEQPAALSGASTLSRRSPDYESGPMESISPQLSYTFHYDAKGDDGWKDPEYVPGASWRPAVPALNSAALRQRPLRQLILEHPHPAGVLTYGTFTDCPDVADKPASYKMQYASLAFKDRVACDKGPLRLPSAEGITLRSADGDGLYTILDLGEEIAGLLTLDIELEREATIYIGFGEHLDDLRVRTHAVNCRFSAVYHAKAGRQSFTHYHKRLGCRYLQLHIYAPAVRLNYAGLRPVMYPLDHIADFDCGDMLMNRIYTTAIRTLRLCMHEHYEDCPWREQSMYAMDSRVQMLCGYYAFNETAMPRESIRLMVDGMREDGFFEMCAPSTFNLTIPSFSLALIGSLKDYVDYTGDTAFAAELLPKFARNLQIFLPQMTQSGLLADFPKEEHWNFYEWNDGLNGQWGGRSPDGRYAPLQAMVILAVEQYLSLCKQVGAAPFAADLPQLADRIRTAAQSLWNTQRQVFVTCADADLPDSELVQALMVCAGIATDEQREILLEKLAHPGENGLTAVTLSYSIFKYDALMSRPERYGAFVRQDIANIWGDLLFKGATSFWETQRGSWDFDGLGSLCHGWSAVPIYVYHRYAEYVL